VIKLTEYVCASCKKKINIFELRRRASCPYCGSKILFKVRPPIQKELKAR